MLKPKNDMNSSMRTAHILLAGFVVSCLPASGVLGQDLDGILAAPPVQVQSENPVTNGSTTDFGSAVDLEGDLLVVGAPREDISTTPGENDSGAAYVFERVGLDWVQQQRLTAPTPVAFEKFGSSVGVALGDEGIDFLVVGAPNYDGSRGRAYVFRRTNGGPWEFEVELTQEEPDPGDRFGQSVAIDFFVPPTSPSGDPVFIIAVGSPMNRSPTPGHSQNGSVAVFQRSGGPPSWGRTHEFFGQSGDLYGSSVAMAEHNIIGGSEGLDEAFFNAGGARIISQGNLTDGAYNYVEGKFMIPSDPVTGVGLGTVTAAHLHPVTRNGAAALGAPLHDDGAGNTGKVLVFDTDFAGPGDSFIESATIDPPGYPPGALFGTSLAIWKNTLAVGAPGVGTDGTVFFFQHDGDLENWNPAGELAAPDVPPVGTCWGGTAVDFEESIAAVGCPSATLLENRAVFLYVSGTIFASGFESGGFGAWSEAYP
jgi:hypothetical protein